MLIAPEASVTTHGNLAVSTEDDPGDCREGSIGIASPCHIGSRMLGSRLQQEVDYIGHKNG